MKKTFLFLGLIAFCIITSACGVTVRTWPPYVGAHVLFTSVSVGQPPPVEEKEEKSTQSTTINTTIDIQGELEKINPDIFCRPMHHMTLSEEKAPKNTYAVRNDIIFAPVTSYLFTTSANGESDLSTLNGIFRIGSGSGDEYCSKAECIAYFVGIVNENGIRTANVSSAVKFMLAVDPVTGAISISDITIIDPADGVLGIGTTKYFPVVKLTSLIKAQKDIMLYGEFLTFKNSSWKTKSIDSITTKVAKNDHFRTEFTTELKGARLDNSSSNINNVSVFNIPIGYQ